MTGHLAERASHYPVTERRLLLIHHPQSAGIRLAPLTYGPVIAVVLADSFIGLAFVGRSTRSRRPKTRSSFFEILGTWATSPAAYLSRVGPLRLVVRAPKGTEVH